jgi:UDP-N-acetylglucosamine/UDP-N-acetylgalactosamine diphosphorylase
MTSEREQLHARFLAAGQGHVFAYVNELSEDETTALFNQLASFHVESLAGFLQAARIDVSATAGTITPFVSKSPPVTEDSSNSTIQTVGLDAIRKGHVAALVLAGGQGTRLGYDGPKGMYDIGLPSGKTLFHMICDRIHKLTLLAGGGSIPFYVMTSPLNHDATVQYFKDHDNFGLETVQCFPQGMLPCLTEDGKIIMETRSAVAMAPDGNGGIYPSMKHTKVLDDMTKRGVQYLHVFSIDNALVKPADPMFIGHCIHTQADCGNKVLWKVHAHEKVGVMAEMDHKPCIVEYSDITKEMAEQTDENGRLVFGAGNICNHFYTLDFIHNVVNPNLGDMYHIARKQIPCYDPVTASQSVTPGIKLESFIFDVFPLSKNMAVVDVERSQEFAPVKNATGADSPETARAMVSALAKQWVEAAGGTVVGDGGDAEIGPLTSYAGEGLEDLVKGKEFTCPFSL